MTKYHTLKEETLIAFQKNAKFVGKAFANCGFSINWAKNLREKQKQVFFAMEKHLRNVAKDQFFLFLTINIILIKI